VLRRVAGMVLRFVLDFLVVVVIVLFELDTIFGAGLGMPSQGRHGTEMVVT
jgi:hypothetical protein